MRNLLALGMFALSCLQPALADESPEPDSMISHCTEVGAGKGYKGKELDEFIAQCMRARRSGIEIDSTILAAMSGC